MFCKGMAKKACTLTVAFVTTLLAASLAQGQEPAVHAESQVVAVPVETSQSVQQSQAASAESYERGLRHYRNRNFTQALQEFSRVLEAEPNRADVLYLIGYCHYILKQFEDSLDAFRRTFEANPKFDPRGIYQARYRPQSS